MAVYTPVEQDDLLSFLKPYDLGEVVAFKGIAEGVENSNFFLETTSGRYILTLYEKRVDRAELPFFIGLMEHSAGAGIPCPTPIHDRDGRALKELNGRPAAIVTFLRGMSPQRPRVVHCAELGRALAKFHTASADFPIQRPNNLSVDGWAKLLAATGDRADNIKSGLGEELREEFINLAACWPAGLPWGVIHADLFPDNVFFVGDRLSGLIDFYFACNDALAYDLVICMNAWCFERDNSFNVTKARALLASYESVRTLTEAERAALPVLARGACLRFLLTRLYDWLNHSPGALVTPKDPLEYWQKLRFHRGITGPGAYGLH
ncbi:MAG TPA: homoserine kinase [Alphaproteobacteria bacterium]|nr:homoserine kinase [Alphaproteobacteria bacterium]